MSSRRGAALRILGETTGLLEDATASPNLFGTPRRLVEDAIRRLTTAKTMLWEEANEARGESAGP